MSDEVKTDAPATEAPRELTLLEINRRLAAHDEALRLARQNEDEALRLAAAKAFSIPTTPALIEATPAAARARIAAKVNAAKADPGKA